MLVPINNHNSAYAKNYLPVNQHTGFFSGVLFDTAKHKEYMFCKAK